MVLHLFALFAVFFWVFVGFCSVFGSVIQGLFSGDSARFGGRTKKVKAGSLPELSMGIFALDIETRRGFRELIGWCSTTWYPSKSLPA